MHVRMRKFSLANRLFIVTGVALLPTLAILAYNEIALRRDRAAEVDAMALRTGELAALEIQRILDGAEGILTAIAGAPVLRGFQPDACDQYLAEVKAGLPQLTAITALDLSGTVRCRSAPPAVTTGYDKFPYFHAALATGGFVIGDYTIGLNSKRALLPLALPIKDQQHATVGVLVAGLDLGWLGARLHERDFSQNRALTIADRNGVIVAREPFPERFVGTRIPDAFQNLVHGDRPGTLEVTSQDGTERIIGYIPAKQIGLYVSAGIAKDQAFAPIDQATGRGALLAVAGAALAFLTAWLLGRGLVRGPVNRVLTTLGAWRAGDLTARTGMRSGEGEIADIGAEIDRSMDELVAARAARRKVEAHRDLLVGELDHRVKNTFATVLAVARQTFTSSDASRDDFRKFSERLKALSNTHQLLMSEHWESADLAETIAACIAPYRGRDGLAERFRVRGEPLQVRAKAALSFSMAVHELCTNAIKYGALSNATGRVEMAWDVDRRPAEPQFAFHWIESGGPAVTPPAETGFGSKMIEQVLALELGGTVEVAYRPSGLVVLVTAALAQVQKGPTPEISLPPSPGLAEA